MDAKQRADRFDHGHVAKRGDGVLDGGLTGDVGGEHDLSARDVVARVIDDFEPNVVAVERTFFSQNRNTALLNVLFDEIRSLARRKRLAFVGYAPSTIKKFICGNGRAGKKQVATVVVSRFPELKVYLTQDRAWKERFHQNMFDAAALGMMIAMRESTERGPRLRSHRV